MAEYNLNTGKKYIRELFSNDSFYSIPEYQRPYVWQKEQIEILLEDLTNAMEQNKEKEYFLGCMIWNTKHTTKKNEKYKYQDILDGQQRFITLYLLQGVLRDLSTDKGLKEQVNERLIQEENEFQELPKRNRIVFDIRDDAEFFDTFLLPNNGTLHLADIEKTVQEKKNSTSVRNMANAIIVMTKWWKVKEREQGENYQKYIKEFYIYLSNRVLALFLATPDNLDDAYNLFTVLNNRGLQLQASDILRAQNLREIKDSDLRKKYAESWNNYVDSVGYPFKSFDEFLWSIVFIKMKYKGDENKSLKKGFDYMYKHNFLSKGVDTFDTIGKYVRHFEELTNNDSTINTEKSTYFSNLIFILTSTFGNAFLTPLLHYRECFGNYKISTFLLKFDNLCSASWLTGKRNLKSRIFIILRKMDELKNKHHFSEDAANEFLNNEVLKYSYQDENAATEISIRELFKIFNDEEWGSFSGSKINKTKYLLLKIDLLMSSFDVRLYYNKNLSSVEHLMPRKPKETEWKNITPEVHRVWLHRLGNLVLVDTRKNASLSNSSYLKKKEKYKNAVENRANTNWVFMTYNTWNSQVIKENHERVLSLLKNYYKGNSLSALDKIKNKLSKNHKKQLF